MCQSSMNLFQISADFPLKIFPGLFESVFKKIVSFLSTLVLGAIQQLRGQEEREAGSAKIPRLSTQVIS